jgi:hypothetical protein
MKRQMLLAGIACTVALGCCEQKPKQAAPVASPESAAVAAAPVSAQEVAMSDAPGTNPSTTNPAPASQPRETRFTGTLRGGVMAIGAETTGWRLERDDGTRVDVSVAKIRDAVAGLDGKRVVIHGGLTTANWTERGRKQLLVAERIEAAPE